MPITGCALQLKRNPGLFRFQKDASYVNELQKNIGLYAHMYLPRTRTGYGCPTTRMLGPRIVGQALIESCSYCIDGFGKMMQKVYNLPCPGSMPLNHYLLSLLGSGRGKGGRILTSISCRGVARGVDHPR